jgi:hypothetical protein
VLREVLNHAAQLTFPTAIAKAAVLIQTLTKSITVAPYHVIYLKTLNEDRSFQYTFGQFPHILVQGF